jgi:hypothetical protein
MINESVDRRVLGAFVCVDAITGGSIVNPLTVTAPQWNIKPNYSGAYVIRDGPNLHDSSTQFAPQTWPGTVIFEVTVQDPTGRYLPRRVQVGTAQTVPAIPPAAPGASSNSASVAALSQTGAVFNPQKVTLFRAPSAPFGPNWAVIHASVNRAGTTPPQGLPWAVVQVTRNSDSTVLVNGLAGATGEALLAVAGLTIETNTTGTGPVTLSTVAVTVTAYFNPNVLTQPAGWIPNPDDILNSASKAAFVSASQPAQLGSGQELLMNFALSF